ncbi:MAG: hypothetical protein GF309_08855 [Candidatus Lokiarchaeota archaeon]|nr:hypothetical protein [Candidatus Lokiarchaeota archaeon]
MDRPSAETVANNILDNVGIDQSAHVEKHTPRAGKMKPSLQVNEEGTIIVKATHESEVRRLVGRYAAKSQWPFYKWLGAAHPYLLTVIAVFSMATIFIIQVLLLQSLPALSIPLFLVSDTIIAALVVVFSYLSLFRFTKWKRELAEYMKDINALNEYDGTLYDPSSVISNIVWSALCLTGFGIFILQYGILVLDMDIFPPLVIYLGIIPAAPVIFINVFRNIGENHCFDYIERENDELRDFTAFEIETAQQLKELLMQETSSLGVEDSFLDNADYGEFDPDLTYREIPFPHCRMFHTYTDETGLNFQIWDMNAAAAKRLIVSRVRRAATPYFHEVSLRRRLSALGKFLFLIFLFPIMALLTIPFGTQFIHPLLLVVAVILAWSTWRDYILHSEAQQSYRNLLTKSEYMTDYDTRYYYNEQFRIMTRVDIGLFIAFLIMAVLVESILFLVI